MTATVLNSPRAVAMSVYIVRAFVKMREDLAANALILKRLAEIDQTLLRHDVALRGWLDSSTQTRRALSEININVSC